MQLGQDVQVQVQVQMLADLRRSQKNISVTFAKKKNISQTSWWWWRCLLLLLLWLRWLSWLLLLPLAHEDVERIAIGGDRPTKATLTESVF